MKNKFKLFGIIAAVALIGFSMVGCDNGKAVAMNGVIAGLVARVILRAAVFVSSCRLTRMT